MYGNIQSLESHKKPKRTSSLTRNATNDTPPNVDVAARLLYEVIIVKVRVLVRRIRESLRAGSV